MSKTGEQRYCANNEVWTVSRLIDLSKDLEVFEIPIRHLNIYNIYPKCESTKEFIEYIKDINNANTDYPIILDDEGYIMDGRHRVFKALIEGHLTIKAVRFKTTPYRCYTIENK